MMWLQANMMHNLRTPLTSLNVITSVMMEEIEMEKKCVAESRDMLDKLASSPALQLLPSSMHKSKSKSDSKISPESLALLQQAVGQMKVV
jgi:hypothetical protein